MPARKFRREFAKAFMPRIDITNNGKLVLHARVINLFVHSLCSVF